MPSDKLSFGGDAHYFVSEGFEVVQVSQPVLCRLEPLDSPGRLAIAHLGESLYQASHPFCGYSQLVYLSGMVGCMGAQSPRLKFGQSLAERVKGSSRYLCRIFNQRYRFERSASSLSFADRWCLG